MTETSSLIVENQPRIMLGILTPNQIFFAINPTVALAMLNLKKYKNDYRQTN